MKKHLSVFLLFAAFGQLANADMINGDFEGWTSGNPDGWTTIDAGIEVSQTTSVVYSGSSAAAVNVLTGTQSSTDLRQAIAVSAGQIYEFSVWVYHTEGQIAARLYVNDYLDYSDYSLTDQWQKLSYRYTAIADGNIEVGLRFYDQSGFDGSEVVYVDAFESSLGDGTGGSSSSSSSSSSSGGSSSSSSSSGGSSSSSGSSSGAGSSSGGGSYYDSAAGMSGYSLKTALYNIIQGHSERSYGELWSFYAATDLDYYFENDGSIIDIYSENPNGSDSYNYTPVVNQCGNYRSEGDCYNREHSFPRAWFGGAIAPMNTDVHHIFASDGYVNAMRGSYPFGEVASISAISSNGSKLGNGQYSQGYTGTVFEPIDAFKGDIARAYFYMATRYQDVIADWENNSDYGDAMLDGSSDQVFECWAIRLLIDWHNADPVSPWEMDRNEAAYYFQGNRNPFIDHPEYVWAIWGSDHPYTHHKKKKHKTNCLQPQAKVHRQKKWKI
ncbi:endonuclease [Microbulbifer aggregans]|uniref:endonuclease n=1 Tax=Microbulbifer aggregans TaxID=1769779 RepID=UPI001CFE5177|nr:endonuclease [Microbulbifer aggregans]